MRKTSLSFLFLCLLLAVTIHCGLRIKNMRLVDELDRQVIVKGGCVVVKVPPYFPYTDHFDSEFSFSARDIQIYKELGMNGVRLGVMYFINN